MHTASTCTFRILMKSEKIRSSNYIFLFVGYTESIFKRKRMIPNINHPFPPLRAQAERQAVNFCVQGMSNVTNILLYFVLERKSIQKGNFMQPVLLINHQSFILVLNSNRE